MYDYHQHHLNFDEIKLNPGNEVLTFTPIDIIRSGKDVQFNLGGYGDYWVYLYLSEARKGPLRAVEKALKTPYGVSDKLLSKARSDFAVTVSCATQEIHQTLSLPQYNVITSLGETLPLKITGSVKVSWHVDDPSKLLDEREQGRFLVPDDFVRETVGDLCEALARYHFQNLQNLTPGEIGAEIAEESTTLKDILPERLRMAIRWLTVSRCSVQLKLENEELLLETENRRIRKEEEVRDKLREEIMTLGLHPEKRITPEIVEILKYLPDPEKTLKELMSVNIAEILQQLQQAQETPLLSSQNAHTTSALNARNERRRGNRYAELPNSNRSRR